MKLLGNRVLLTPASRPMMSPGGVLYDMSRNDDRMQWFVLLVGPGRRLKGGTTLMPEVRPGDKCLFNPGMGVLYDFDDGRIIVDAEQIQMRWH